MADENGGRARRAAEPDDDGAQPSGDLTGAADNATGSRPKRFMTPDWDWDEGSSGDSPDDDADQAAPARGGRFAADLDAPADSTPLAPQTPAAARGRFSLEEDVPRAWPDRTSDARQPDAPAWPAPTLAAPHTSGSAPAGRARHGWADESSTTDPQPTIEQPAVASPAADDASAQDPGAWHAIPVEPAHGASRAAQSPTLGEKRRREAPALPTTPQPLSPAERREALAARERAGRAVAPGSLPTDDWADAPLPASAVPPPAVGQAPTPIAVQEGDAPVAHRAYTRPADGSEDEDEDTLWLSRRPSSRAAQAPPQPEAHPSSAVTPVTPAPVVADESSLPPVELPATGVVRAPATSAWPVPVGTGSERAASTGGPPAGVPAEAPGAAPEAGTSTTETPRVRPKLPGVRNLWRRRPFQIGAAALILVVALVAGFLVWANRERPSAAASSQSVATLVDHLVSPADLTGVGPGGWTEQKTESTVTQDSAAPLCYVASPDLPTPTAQAQRKLSATGATMLHRITTYATAADAGQVYAQRLTQLGQCSNVPVYLSSGAAITSLGDAAVGVTAVIQDTTPQYHTVILVRTGSMIITFDVAQAGTAITYETVLSVAATTVKAVCTLAGGGCSATPAAITGIPPNSSVPGWLTVSDLPRITPGMGRWNATAPRSSVTSQGSACENVTFANVTGPNQKRQRTYLLTEDTKVPKDFGLDEIILDFNTADAASTFAAQLQTSITACPARTATAKLGNTGDITATGASGQAITGFWRTVTQSTNPATTFIFRVGVASVGTRVVYLLATPSSTFDFTDADWSAIVSRAGQRATQGG